MTPRMMRGRIRRGEWMGTTSGLCPGYVQANLVILPAQLASAFREFCERNPGPCPLIEQTAPGASAPSSAPDADLRRDVPRYRVYRDGVLEGETGDLRSLWRADLVSFLLGCSFTFEAALVRAGIALRHQEARTVVPMYVTDRACEPAGPFEGPLVVSMRPISAARVDEASAITARFPESHGAPVHAGDPAALGIEDLSVPDYGDAVEIRPNEVPVFWACGVTPQAVAERARPELMVSHAPGHMFLTDLPAETGQRSEEAGRAGS